MKFYDCNKFHYHGKINNKVMMEREHDPKPEGPKKPMMNRVKYIFKLQQGKSPAWGQRQRHKKLILDCIDVGK